MAKKSPDLRALIDQATVDAYDEDEQAAGFFAVLEENLQIPFSTTVLGMPVVVESLELGSRNRISAICKREGHRQRISLEDVTLPKPAPRGAEWVAAYCLWLRDSD